MCGQPAHVHRTLGGLWHDIAHGVFHFEGKVWRMLPMLAWQPGVATRRYVHGERARFVSPLALFLFSVLVMFAVFGSVGGPIRNTDGSGTVHFDRSELMTGPRKARLESTALMRERSAMARKGAPTVAIDRRLSSVQSEITELGAAAAISKGDLSIAMVLPNSGETATNISGGEAKIFRALQNPAYAL